MREIVYKNLTGSDNKRRDVYIRELVSRDGVIARVERRCIYFVREKLYVENLQNLEELKSLKSSEESWRKKHFHILRRHDSYTGEDQLICKVAGTFYAVVGHYVYCIAFVHSFKMDLAVVYANQQEN